MLLALLYILQVKVTAQMFSSGSSSCAATGMHYPWCQVTSRLLEEQTLNIKPCL
jgi:hypothetical protein